MDWALEGVVSWFGEGVEYVLHIISFMFTDLLGISLDQFENYFPAVKTTYEVILVMGMTLLLLIFVFQLTKSLLGPLTESESPMRLLVKTVMFGVLLYYSKEICQIVLNICLPHGEFEGFIHLINSSLTYGGIESGATLGLDAWEDMEIINNTVLGDIVAVGSGGTLGVFMILANTIILIIVAWTYFKVCFEVVERYVLFGIMAYLSPLAFATGGSQSTSNIFKAWVRMFGSQLLLLLLNVWFLRVFVHGLSNAMSNWQGGGTDWFITLFMAISWLRICMHLDGHLSSLGLNVAQTGAGLGAEVFASIHMAASTGRTIVGGAGAIFKNGKGSGSAYGSASKGPQGPTTLDTFRPGSAILDGNITGSDRRAGMGGIMGAAQRVGGRVAGLFGAEIGERQLGMVVNGGLGSSARIAGSVADKSLKNLIPSFKGMDKNISGTQISSGAIATSMNFSGKNADVSMSKQKPRSGEYASIQDAFGNRWYAQATGEGAEGFYKAFGQDISNLAGAEPKRRLDEISGTSVDKGMQSFMPVEGYHYEGTVVGAGSISTNLVSDTDPNMRKELTMSRADLLGSDDYQKAGDYEGYSSDGTKWFMSGSLSYDQADNLALENHSLSQTSAFHVDAGEYGRVPVFSKEVGERISFQPYMGDNESSVPLDNGSASMLTSINADGTTSTWRAVTEGSLVPEGASMIQSDDGQSYYSMNANYSVEPRDFGFSSDLPLIFDEAKAAGSEYSYPVFTSRDADGSMATWLDIRDAEGTDGSIILTRSDGSEYVSDDYKVLDAPSGMTFLMSEDDREMVGVRDGAQSTWYKEERHLIPDDASVITDAKGNTWYSFDMESRGSDSYIHKEDSKEFISFTEGYEKNMETVKRYEDRIEIRHDDISRTIMYDETDLINKDDLSSDPITEPLKKNSSNHVRNKSSDSADKKKEK